MCQPNSAFPRRVGCGASVRNAASVTKVTRSLDPAGRVRKARLVAWRLLIEVAVVSPPPPNAGANAGAASQADRSGHADAHAHAHGERTHVERTGYLSAAYARSLGEFGTPMALPRSESWILQRQVAPGIADAMGPYPLFCCRDWQALAGDLEDVGRASAGGAPLTSLVVVTDPFGPASPDLLAASFPDRVAPFKEHYVADLSRPLASFVSAHHRRYASRRVVEVAVCSQPLDWLDDWCALYANLCARHQIRGIPALSRAAFTHQLNVPGLTAFRASAGGATLGMVLWYRHDDVAYYHLAAYSDQGYQRRASFPLFWASFEHLATAGVRWASLGAGPSAGGTAPSQGTDGLIRFKKGWSTETRLTYLCGRIFRPEVYGALSHERGFADSRYFPAYRQGELA